MLKGSIFIKKSNTYNIKTLFIMKKILIPFVLIFFALSFVQAQKVRWSYAVEGSEAGAGVPNTFTEGFNAKCAAVLKENKETKEQKQKAKKPELIKFYFMPFDAQQVVISENYNAGAIVKIEVESYADKSDKLSTQTIYEGKASAVKGYKTSNYNFPVTKNVVCVNVYVDYTAVPGVNQIAGVGICNFPEAYSPKVNISKDIPFDAEVMPMNEDVYGKRNPSTPIITVDGKYIYFNHEDAQGNNQIFRGSIGADGKISRVELSDFNIPTELSVSSAITSISQDNNIAYVNDMTLGKPTIYKNYVRKNKKGVSSWTNEEIKFKGFESRSEYLFDCMSYDGKYYFVNMYKLDSENKFFMNDIYVAFRNKKGEYENFTHMGYDINTIGNEIPCFLAADNKTFVFASSGHLGFGEKDIFITKRLDDSWTNWTQPINIGNVVNTEAQENYFSIDSKGEYAYFVRWEDKQSNLYRISLHKAETTTPKVETIKPDPIIIIKGRVLDKKTNLPLQAEVIYTNILTSEVMGEATSNSETGEYTVALPAGKFYSYLGKADNYLPVSENFDARDITETAVIENDLYLVPVEIGQTIRLNNIFFDSGKSVLKPESFEELNTVVDLLNNSPKMEIAVAGHTDNVGSAESNLKLSDDRANSVRTYLISKGISEIRITAQGYGETKPIATNDTNEGKQTNRRVEFTIVK